MATQSPSPAAIGEETTVHTDLIRTPLLVEACRDYWEVARHDVPGAERAETAFSERWFGSISLERIRRLLGVFARRFDAYPDALAVLRHWRPADPVTRRLICHWHQQLSDPIYRQFAGPFLEQRRAHPEPVIDRDIVARWLLELTAGKWAVATTNKIATNLLRSAEEAGLCTGRSGRRRPCYPPIDDTALGYLLYLLRPLTIRGSLLDNPYLSSVGFGDGLIEHRLAKVPGITFRRQGPNIDLEWHYPTLRGWADATLGTTGASAR